MTDHGRRVLVVSHTGRTASLEAAGQVLALLTAGDVTPVLTADERDDIAADGRDLAGVQVLGDDVEVADLELVIVLGGDGTILRAAELVRGTPVPLLGVNLGHVGFLAEAERDDLGSTVGHVVAREYDVEERMCLDVSVLSGDVVVHRDWALNEATVEKASRERMLEVVVEVDGHPLVSFGCDGTVIATPTGSTAYSFSAGGPIVWPALDALLFVPLSAHALFARPLVVDPTSVVAVEVLQRTEGNGVLWCDGRRTVDLAPGSRLEVRRSDRPVRLARLSKGRFSDRLVQKFNLPVDGWRGPAGK